MKWENEGFMDNGIEDSIEEGAGTGVSHRHEVDGKKQGVDSRDRQGKVYHKERSVTRSEDDVGGRARVTRDEERVLRGG